MNSLASVETRRPVVLRDGSMVVLRPVVPDDRARVAEAFSSLSEASRYLRFHAPMPRYSARLLDFLVAADGTDHVAWVALDGDACVGIARFVRLSESPSTAEVAVTVVDDYHGRGLGRVLMEAVTASAAQQGIETLQWFVLPTNHRAIALMRSLSVPFHLDGGVLYGTQPVGVKAVAEAA